MNAYEEIRKGERGAWISIVAYLVLSAFKLICGYLFNSSALLADGINNATDIVASVAVLIGLRISQKPPDSDHAYGHFRAETIAALIASFIMAVVGLQVLVEAVRSWYAGDFAAPNLWAAGVAVICAVVMLGVYRYNSRLAKKINSQALLAAAKDNRSDAWVSIGAAIGIVGSQFGLPWLDKVAAILVGLLICKTAWEIFRDSTHLLTDGFDQKQLTDLRSAVLVDVVIEVDGGLTLVEGHEICDQVEERLKRSHNIMHVHVHVEPRA